MWRPLQEHKVRKNTESNNKNTCRNLLGLTKRTQREDFELYSFLCSQSWVFFSMLASLIMHWLLCVPFSLSSIHLITNINACGMSHRFSLGNVWITVPAQAETHNMRLNMLLMKTLFLQPKGPHESQCHMLCATKKATAPPPTPLRISNGIWEN